MLINFSKIPVNRNENNGTVGRVNHHSLNTLL